jgi:hypothetical protein
VFPALLEVLDATPTSLGSWTTLTAVTPEQLAAGEDVSVFFEGQLVGTPAELASILAPVYAIAQPLASQSTIQEMSYWDAQEEFFADTPEPSKLQKPQPLLHRADWPRRHRGHTLLAAAVAGNVGLCQSKLFADWRSG